MSRVIPILFSGPMVKGILTGQKVQTRRLAWKDALPTPAPWQALVPGDMLWVRENLERAEGEGVGYPADGERLPNTTWIWQRNRLPAIHMPRCYSRMTLEVTHVRRERLQAISREDAIAEGIVRAGSSSLRWERWCGMSSLCAERPQDAYALLWNKLHGPGSWERNPEVVVIDFRAHRRNIDAPAQAA